MRAVLLLARIHCLIEHGLVSLTRLRCCHVRVCCLRLSRACAMQADALLPLRYAAARQLNGAWALHECDAGRLESQAPAYARGVQSRQNDQVLLHAMVFAEKHQKAHAG